MAALSSSSRSSAGNTPSFVGNSSVPTAASVVSRPPRSREALASFASDPALQGSVPDAASLRPVASSLLAPRLKHHPSSSGLKASVGPWSPALPAPASGPFSQQPAYSMYAPHALDAWAPLGTALPEPAAAATPSAPVNDDIIPNAIVIKNIPFSLPFEALTALMVDLALPMPYAFNYHYDQGVFRGLAFANFRAAEDAGKVLAALNGFDVSGRKLKTEYKKVLQAEERERIQKQKALQRMQSFQIEKSKERQRRQMIADIHQERTASPTTTCTTSISNSPKSNRSYGSSLLSLNPTEPDSGVYPVRAPFSLNPVNTNGTGCMALPRSPSVGTCSFMLNSGQKDELDMNDPVTLDIYSRILLFTDDRMHDEISFSKSLSPSEHRVVHAVAERLGLFHYSVGYGEETRAVVSKVRPSSPQVRIPTANPCSSWPVSGEWTDLSFF